MLTYVSALSDLLLFKIYLLQHLLNVPIGVQTYLTSPVFLEPKT